MTRRDSRAGSSGADGCGPCISDVRVSAFSIPTATPESDGTLEWNATTLVLVEVEGGGKSGIGFSYADTATATLIHDVLCGVIQGRSVFSVGGCWGAMVAAIRNLGRPGICSMAIAAVDNALWDLKARILDLPLVSLLGAVRAAVPVYGSGGFTSYKVPELQEQLAGWTSKGISRVKMKIGRKPHDDADRVRAAREAIGSASGLFVDANGAYSRKQALAMASSFAESNVSWFEEPVSSDDLEGLRLIRAQAILHGHCHQKALIRMDDEKAVLEKMNMNVENLDSGCCGMAGSFGFDKDKYEISTQIGESVVLSAIRSAEPETLIIADGYSCRDQISQTTNRRSLHAAEVIHMTLNGPAATSSKEP